MRNQHDTATRSPSPLRIAILGVLMLMASHMHAVNVRRSRHEHRVAPPARWLASGVHRRGARRIPSPPPAHWGLSPHRPDAPRPAGRTERRTIRVAPCRVDMDMGICASWCTSHARPWRARAVASIPSPCRVCTRDPPSVRMCGDGQALSGAARAVTERPPPDGCLLGLVLSVVLQAAWARAQRGAAGATARAQNRPQKRGLRVSGAGGS